MPILPPSKNGHYMQRFFTQSSRIPEQQARTRCDAGNTAAEQQLIIGPALLYICMFTSPCCGSPPLKRMVSHSHGAYRHCNEAKNQFEA